MTGLPIPPRAPSPNPPRPSTSSNRSLRRTEADFEAVLLNPTATIFLSASNGRDDDPVQASPPQKIDRDAPDPVEKRSFEDDLRRERTPAKRVGLIPPTPSTAGEGSRSLGAPGGSADSTPVRMVSSRKTGQSLGIDGGFCTRSTRLMA